MPTSSTTRSTAWDWRNRQTRSGFDPRPGAGSAAVNALYTVPSGFDVSGNGFAGAFGTGENWMDGWTNFDPQNTVY